MRVRLKGFVLFPNPHPHARAQVSPCASFIDPLKQICMQKKFIFLRKKKATHPVLLHDIPGFKYFVLSNTIQPFFLSLIMRHAQYGFSSKYKTEEICNGIF
jgi:hypothetical protein